MKEQKNIDRLFQEKFRDFEVTPSDIVWNNIKGRIDQTPQKNRRAIWLWFGSIAAGMALLFYMYKPGTNIPEKNQKTTETHIQKPIVTPESVLDTDQNLTTQVTEENTNSSTPSAKKEKPTTLKKPIPHNIASNNANASTHKQERISNNKSGSVLQNKVPFNNNTPPRAPEDKAIASTEQKLNPTTPIDKKSKILPDSEDSNVAIVPKKKKKWSVSTLAAPVYLSAFDKNTSSIDARFNNNTKQGSFSAAYGVQLAYQLNPKFSLQSGVQIVDYGYKTYNIFVSPSGRQNQYSNINYSTDANLVAISAAPAEGAALDETNIRESKGSLMQVFGYVEVPIEVKYHLGKGNLGFNVIGGFSTLFLNKNQIFIETDGLSSEIGEASNLNSLNFSGNLGLEFDYKIYQNLHFNLTPMFKVQTHTFEKNTGGFNPYAIGVYSGLNLRF